ncbi:MAG TPA: hypothetical protein VFG23_10540 [Polyangia bacterium]|nr:hypothetical protein [Polyangia bacterium]
MGLLGIPALPGIAFAVSNNRRRALNPRILGWGLGLRCSSDDDQPPG